MILDESIGLGIRAIGTATGTSCDVDDHLFSRFEPPDILRSMVGENELKSFFRMQGKTLPDLAITACEDALEQSGLNVDDIDLIVFCHTLQTSAAVFPLSMTQVLQDHFGVRPKQRFSLHQVNCTSAMVAMRTVDALMATDDGLNNVLLVTADKVMFEVIRCDGLAIDSDGVTAMILSRRSPTGRIVSVQTHFESAYHTGMNAAPIPLFKSINFLRGVITRCAQDMSRLPAELTHLVPHNGNPAAWKAISKLLNISTDKIFTENIRQAGHLFCGDAPFNMSCLQKAGQLNKGDHVVCVTIGLGMAYGAIGVIW